jgi:site-specific DNA-methyltransferase (adenine-specific)
MKKRAPRRATSTSAFGTSGRISHDASKFYESKLYRELQQSAAAQTSAENTVPAHVVDSILEKSSESMDQLPDTSVNLMITSPPYNVSKEYDDDLSLEEYRSLLSRVFAETYRVLVPGGRACINVANVGRKPYIPLHAFLVSDLSALGYLMRGEIIWNKGSSAGPSTSWGSWLSPSNPSLRDVHEYILVFSKQAFARPRSGKRSTIGRDEFLELTKSVWTFPAESARRVGHPAPFPVELPRRLIELYSYAGEIILDPFAGSGSTCIAALQTGRHFVAYEKVKEYVDLAKERISRAVLPAR